MVVEVSDDCPSPSIRIGLLSTISLAAVSDSMDVTTVISISLVSHHGGVGIVTYAGRTPFSHRYVGLSLDNVRRRPMDTILRLPQGHSRDDVRRKPLGNNLTADTISRRQPITPSTALARLTKTTNRIKLLIRRSTSRDGLWDVTESALKTLRNQFNSRLCILRSLWYAEPFRLVTVGR